MAQQQSQTEYWRNDLRNLSWSQGFSKEGIMNQFPNIPQAYFQNVPSGLKFYSFNEFWDYFSPTGTPGAVVGEPGAVPHTYPQQGYGGR